MEEIYLRAVYDDKLKIYKVIDQHWRKVKGLISLDLQAACDEVTKMLIHVQWRGVDGKMVVNKT